MSDRRLPELESGLTTSYRDVADTTPPLGRVRREPITSRDRRRGGIVAVLAVAAAVLAVIGTVHLFQSESATALGPTDKTSNSVAPGGVVGHWRATELEGHPPPLAPDARYEAVLILRADGTFTAFDSCKSIEGEYVSDEGDGSLRFTTSRSRSVRCGVHYAHPLEATRFALKGGGDELVLLDDSGHRMADYQRER